VCSICGLHAGFHLDSLEGEGEDEIDSARFDSGPSDTAGSTDHGTVPIQYERDDGKGDAAAPSVVVTNDNQVIFRAIFVLNIFSFSFLFTYFIRFVF